MDMNEVFIEQPQSGTDVSDSEALGLSSSEHREKVDQGQKEPESSSKVRRKSLDWVITMALYSQNVIHGAEWIKQILRACEVVQLLKRVWVHNHGRHRGRGLCTSE